MYREGDNYYIATTEPEAKSIVKAENFTETMTFGNVTINPTVSGLCPIYRCHLPYASGKGDDFLLTNSISEARSAIAAGYEDNGIVFYCACNPGDFGAWQPLYRYWTTKRHYYTTSTDEGKGILVAGGQKEGTLCYIRTISL